MQRTTKTHLPERWFLTDHQRVNKPFDAVPKLPIGCGIIMRDYGLSADARHARAIELATLCQAQKRPFLIAADAALAQVVGADGLHIPEGLFNKINGADIADHWIVTASCHSVDALKTVDDTRTDALFVSPIFATKSHVGTHPLGPDGLKNIADHAQSPFYALGGMTENRYQTLKNAQIKGLIGYAAISEFLSS